MPQRHAKIAFAAFIVYLEGISKQIEENNEDGHWLSEEIKLEIEGVKHSLKKMLPMIPELNIKDM